MTWVMDDKEFEAVLSLPAQPRYAYLLKRVVDWERIWSLGTQEGWALSSDVVKGQARLSSRFKGPAVEGEGKALLPRPYPTLRPVRPNSGTTRAGLPGPP